MSIDRQRPAASSSGRTPEFDSGNLGSNPGVASNDFDTTELRNRHRRLPEQNPDLPDDIKSEYWKVLFFTRDGRAIRSLTTHSERDARRLAVECDYELKNMAPPYFTWDGENGTFFTIDYSHCMPIPWKKQ